MMRYSMIFSSAALLFLGFTACKKSDNANSSKTMANISGSYNLAALTASLGSINYNLYDTLPDCQKDNVIILNADSTAQFVDGGITCDPPGDSTAIWHLSAHADSLYLGNNATFIQKFDGKNLVVTADRFNGYTGEITITLARH
ncbi:MAG TPA: hypothetical protein VGM24_08495 [Puia sp.]